MSDKKSAIGKKIAAKKGVSGRVEFLAQLAEIQTAIEEGFRTKQIWEVLKSEGKFSGSYSMFTRYINGIILGKKDTRPAPPKTVASPSPSAREIAGTEPEKMNTKPDSQSEEITTGPIKIKTTKAAEVVRTAKATDIEDDQLY